MKYTLVLVILLVLGCNTSTYTQPLNLAGFDWEGHEKLHLEHVLDEVSGITFFNNNTLLAINDERGKVYKVSTKDYKVQENIKFSGNRDYEAIAGYGKELFVMDSDGDLWYVQLKGDEVKQVKEYKFDLKKGVEFEALVWEEGTGVLYLISKQSDENKEQKASVVYSFDIAKERYALASKKNIHWAAIAERSEDKKLHVSGAAIHPKSKKVYLVASIERLLIILNEDWSVEEVHRLDKKLFKQPEGITFDKAGNLYISNEARGGRPNVIRIPIKK